MKGDTIIVHLSLISWRVYTGDDTIRVNFVNSVGSSIVS